jgi:hypothetical protein
MSNQFEIYAAPLVVLPWRVWELLLARIRR